MKMALLLGDGYQAALINYGYLANAVLATKDVVSALSKIFAARYYLLSTLNTSNPPKGIDDDD
jgi:hypothetical protein